MDCIQNLFKLNSKVIDGKLFLQESYNMFKYKKVYQYCKITKNIWLLLKEELGKLVDELRDFLNDKNVCGSYVGYIFVRTILAMNTPTV